jgi:hypothetical protein
VIPAVLGLLWCVGASFTLRREVTMQPATVEMYAPAPEFASTPTPPVSHEEPIDELWMRLNEPRIELSASPGGPAPPVEPAPNEQWKEPHEAEAPAAAAAEDSWDSDSAHEAEATASETVSAEVAETAGAGTAEAERARAEAEVQKAKAVTAANKDSAKARPEWVGEPPRMVGEIYRVPVEAGPYTSLQECYPALRQNLRQVVNERIVELVRDATGKPYVSVPTLEYLNIGNSYIDRELLTDQYVEVSDTSVGPMKTAWGLLEFTPQQDQQLVDAWKRYARREGLAKTSLAAVLVLMLLGGVFALLKIDTWTRGYYTKRLFIGVPAAIIAVIVLLAMANA